MAILREVGACDLEETTLTPLGHHLATLPVNVRIGKMMIFGAIFGCMDAVVSTGMIQPLICEFILHNMIY